MIDFVQLKMVSPEIVERLVKESYADNHPVYFTPKGCKVAVPTHVATLKDDIVGAFSLGNVPLIQTWLHTVKMKNKARESFNLIQCVTNIMAGWGHEGVFMPIHKTSPLNPFMEGLGFVKACETELFYKELR